MPKEETCTSCKGSGYAHDEADFDLSFINPIFGPSPCRRYSRVLSDIVDFVTCEKCQAALRRF